MIDKKIENIKFGNCLFCNKHIYKKSYIGTSYTIDCDVCNVWIMYINNKIKSINYTFGYQCSCYHSLDYKGIYVEIQKNDKIKIIDTKNQVGTISIIEMKKIFDKFCKLLSIQ